MEINHLDEVDEKIQEVLRYDEPVICKVKTPEWQILQPRISSEKMPDGMVAHKYAGPCDDREMFTELY